MEVVSLVATLYECLKYNTDNRKNNNENNNNNNKHVKPESVVCKLVQANHHTIHTSIVWCISMANYISPPEFKFYESHDLLLPKQVSIAHIVF